MKPKSKRFLSLVALFLALGFSGSQTASAVEISDKGTSAAIEHLAQPNANTDTATDQPSSAEGVSGTSEASNQPIEKTPLTDLKETSADETVAVDLKDPKDTTEKDKDKAGSLIPVIIETRNTPALELADRQDKEAYAAAVSQADADVKASFETIRTYLAEHGYSLEANYFFSASFTGFSAQLPEEVVELLKNLPSVASINRQNEGHKIDYETNMLTSGELVGLVENLRKEFNYRGESVVVSVLDTGFDPDHKDFKMDAYEGMRYTKDQMDAFILENNLPGKWYSNKIPYGYDYADLTTAIKDTDQQHGMHVAGIIGANGNPNEGGIQGVAPNVQILAMKVFSSDHVGTVFEDVWLKAIDDSIKLGADVINMSLGMASGFVLNGKTPSEQAFHRARQHGVLPLVALGNDHNPTWQADYNNLYTNPDTSVAGYPATAASAFSVGSVDNIAYLGRYVEISYGENQTAFFPRSQSVDKDTLAPTPVVAVGIGEEENYTGVDVTGKIALVQRGKISFGDKYKIALAHGAAAVLIYDNVESDFTMEMVGIDYQDGHPVAFVRKVDGEHILDLSTQDQNFKLAFPEGTKPFNLRSGGNVSDFSSWGPATDLTLKPDISAPGGNIYSTISDDGYTTMSGTSMATPYTAGLAALLVQHLYAKGILKGSPAEKDPAQADLVKLLLMNTAVPKFNTVDNDAWYYTPREQGAGLVNIDRALNNMVSVTATTANDTIEDGKLEIKEVGDNFDFTLKLHNYGDQARTYEIVQILIKSIVGDDGRYTETTQKAMETVLGTVTVAANGDATFNGTASTTGIDEMQFVEGYFILKAKHDGDDVADKHFVDLTVPYLGFKGDWSKPAIIDNMIDFTSEDAVNFKPIYYYGEDGNITGVDKSAFVYRNKKQGWNYWAAFNENGEPTVFVNAHGQDGFENEVLPVLSFLRNAKDLQFYVVDEYGNVVRRLWETERIYKAGKLYQNKYNFLQKMDWAGWNFTDASGEAAPDGKYYYMITGAVDYEGATPQTYKYAIVLDNEAPDFTYEVDPETKKLTIHATDNLSGIRGYEIHNPYTNQWTWQVWNQGRGEEVDKLSDSWTFDLNDAMLMGNGDLEVMVYDYSGNTGRLQIKLPDSLVVKPNAQPEPEAPSPSPDPAETTEPNEGNQPEENNHPAEDNQPENDAATESREVNPDEYSDGEGVKTAELPILKIETPSYYTGYGNDDDTLSIAGTIEQVEELHRVAFELLNDKGEKYERVLGPEAFNFKLVDGKYHFAADFDISGITETDQYNIILTAYGKSADGHLVKRRVRRQIRIDRNAPVLEVEQIKGPKEDKAYFKIHVNEDMSYAEVQVNGQTIKRYDKTYDTLKPTEIDETLYTSVPLKYGKNVIVFEAYDDTGNVTRIEKIIIRTDDSEWRPDLDPTQPPIEVPTEEDTETPENPEGETGKDETDPNETDKENGEGETQPEETDKDNTDVVTNPEETDKDNTDVVTNPEENDKDNTDVVTNPEENDKDNTDVVTNPEENDKDDKDVVTNPEENDKDDKDVVTNPEENDKDNGTDLTEIEETQPVDSNTGNSEGDRHPNIDKVDENTDPITVTDQDSAAEKSDPVADKDLEASANKNDEASKATQGNTENLPKTGALSTLGLPLVLVSLGFGLTLNKKPKHKQK